MNPLNKLIQEKFIKNKSFCAYYSIYDNDKTFRFNVNWQDNNVNDLFLSEIEKTWNQSQEDKNFNFYIHDMAAFKKDLIHSFIKKESFSNFQNAYHSFFKNFGMIELFTIYCKDNYTLKNKNNPYQKHILFTLNQDFKKHKDFHPFDFIKTINLNFMIPENKYCELKENLFVFLQNHYSLAKTLYVTHYSNEEEKNVIKEFDLSVYNGIRKHIKKEDLHIYKEYWKSINIKENINSLFSISEEKNIIFDVNYSFLEKNYPSIIHVEYAQQASDFVLSTINHNFKELQLTKIQSDESSYQFLCIFKSNLTQDDLLEIIKKSFDIFEKCKISSNIRIKNEFEDIYEQEIKNISAFIAYSILNNELKDNSEVKQIKLKI